MYKLLDYNKSKEIYNTCKKEFDFDEDTFTCSMYQIIEDNQEIGFFGLENRNDNLCICYLYIYEQHRKKGYCKKVLSDIIEKNKNDYLYIYGFVEKTNKRALKIYSNYSFLHKNCHDLCKIPFFAFENEIDNVDKILHTLDNKSYEVCFNFNFEIQEQLIKKENNI